MERAIVFDFHRGTTHDGPGMRTTVFLKGCPLHCLWCHNPESISPRPEVVWEGKKCIGCGNCVKNAPDGSITLADGEIRVRHREGPTALSAARLCPSRALHTIGQEWEIPALVREACKDKMFFDDFEGGVTVSGGEPTLQSHALLLLMEQLKAEGVQTALDTSGFAKWEIYEQLFPFVDIFLYDMKIMDAALHRQFTGVENGLILENLLKLADKIRENPEKRLWIRTPLIPGATATRENIGAIGQYIAGHLLDTVERWELCAFNNVCKNKYHELGQEWFFEETPLMEEGQAQELASLSKIYAGDKIVVSGLTRKPDKESINE